MRLPTIGFFPQIAHILDTVAHSLLPKLTTS
jgi:hypothetical protein